MARQNMAGPIISMFIVLIFVIVGSIYAFGIYSEHNSAVDLSETTSPEMYETHQAERNVTLSLLWVVEIIIAIGLLLGALSAWRAYS